MSGSTDVLAKIDPFGNSDDELIAWRDGDHVRIDVTTRDGRPGKDEPTRSSVLLAGDVVEIASKVWGNKSFIGIDTRVTVVRGDERSALAYFRFDMSWGGYFHEEIVAALQPVAEAAGATIVAKNDETLD